MATNTKMTLTDLATFTAGYVDAAKQGGAWSATTDNLCGFIDKIGKQVSLTGGFEDKLPELDGDNNLPYGKTIEEFMIDLSLPSAWSGIDNAVENTAYLPPVEECTYSYTLGRKKIENFIPSDNFERGCLGGEEAGNVVAKIYGAFQSSIDLTRYAVKKQLIGNAITKAVAVGNVATKAVPVDDTTGEAFIKQIKSDVEEASFAHMHSYKNNAGTTKSVLIGAAPSLTLYVKKGVLPSIEVDTLAGAFNQDRLALPCKVKVVDDFGTITGAGATAYAVLVDDRAIRLHNSYKAVRTKELVEADGVKSVYHFEDTGFISKYAYIKAYKAS